VGERGFSGAATRTHDQIDVSNLVAVTTQCFSNQKFVDSHHDVFLRMCVILFQKE